MGSVHARHTERVTKTEEREGANGVGGGKGDENQVRGGSGDVNGDGDGDRTGMITGVEANEGTQDENGDGSGNREEIGTERG